MRGAGDEDLDVVVIKTLGAPPRRRRRPKRMRADAPQPEPVAISRATVVRADAFADESEARRWLEETSKRQEPREREVEAALRSINRAVHAYRLASHDPYVGEVNREQARQVRLGYGSGDEVVEGYWQAAVAVPHGRRQRRRAVLAPQEEVAAILTGRRPTHASEDLALRARLDLEQGRPVQAALQLRAAVDALEAERHAREERPGQEERSAAASSEKEADEHRIAWPGERSTRVRELATAALRGHLDDRQLSVLSETLEELERTLRKRRWHSA